jgi:hypothetical protein
MAEQPTAAARRPGPTGGKPMRMGWFSWRRAAGTAGLAGGALMVTGAFLPWVTTFAGLIGVPGVRGGNGRLLAAAGLVIALAGLAHLARGGRWSRWLIGGAGFAATGFAGFLLLQLAASMRVLSTEVMVAAHSGPGLWTSAAGAVLAFITLFFPASTQQVLVRRDPRGGLAAWAADRNSAGLRRGLQLTLGALWLADGALQLQPVMFGRGFAAQILMPAYMGSPAAVTGPATAFARLILHAPAAWNTAFAATQLLLGLGLLWRPTVRAALAASIGWALAVWWFGEGLGGVFSGSATPLTGAPGAAALYALLAVLAWPAPAARADRSPVAAGSPLRLGGARAAWLALWAGEAYLVLQAASRAPGALRATVTGLASGEPGWLAGMDRAVAGAAGSHGTAVAVILAVAFVLTGLGVCWPAATRPALALAAVAALGIWVFGENVGGLATGQATDPNSGPLLLTLAAAFWPRRCPQAHPAGPTAQPQPHQAQPDREHPDPAPPAQDQPHRAQPSQVQANRAGADHAQPDMEASTVGSIAPTT